MGLRKFIKVLRKNQAPPENNPNESGLLSDLRFRSDKTNDGSLPSRYRIDFAKPSMMDTDSSSEESQEAVVPNEFDDLVPVKLSCAEEDFADWLNDDSAISEVKPPAMPAWAHSEATFEAKPDDLTQNFEPLPEANDERSDAVLSQPIEPLHQVHQKPSVAALSQNFEPLSEMPVWMHSEATFQAWPDEPSQKFEPLPGANEERSDAVLSQPIEPLHEVHQKPRVATLSQRFEPQPEMPAWMHSEATFQAWPDDVLQNFEPLTEANEERSDAVLSQPIEPLHEVNQKPSVAASSQKFEPLSEMPAWAHSKATFQAWPDDLSQKFEPLPEANEERSDAVLSQPIEPLQRSDAVLSQPIDPLYKVHQKPSVTSISQIFEALPDANKDQSNSVLSQPIEPLPNANEEQRDAVLSQIFERLPNAREEQSDAVSSQMSEPQVEARKEQSDDVGLKKFEPLSETHDKPSTTTFSLYSKPVPAFSLYSEPLPNANANANANAGQRGVVTLRQRLKELSSILPKANEEEEEMKDNYLLFDAVGTPDDSLLHTDEEPDAVGTPDDFLLHTDEEPDDLPCKASKTQDRNIVAAPEEILLLNADSLLDAVEEAGNAIRQVGEHCLNVTTSFLMEDNYLLFDAVGTPDDSLLHTDEEPDDLPCKASKKQDRDIVVGAEEILLLNADSLLDAVEETGDAIRQVGQHYLNVTTSYLKEDDYLLFDVVGTPDDYLLHTDEEPDDLPCKASKKQGRNIVVGAEEILLLNADSLLDAVEEAGNAIRQVGEHCLNVTTSFLMEDNYLIFDAVGTPDDSLLHTDKERNNLPCKASKKQVRNIVAGPKEIPLLKADLASGACLLGPVEEAPNALRQAGGHHKESPGHAEDSAIFYEIDQDDNSIVELSEGSGDSHMEDDEEPFDPLLGVVVESDHPRFADAEDDESFLVGVEEASDFCLGPDARERESLLDADKYEVGSLLDNDDDESLLDEYGDDSLLDAQDLGCVSLMNLDDLDSLAELLDSGPDEQIRCGWCEDAVVKTTVKGLKGLANPFQRESGLPRHPEYLKRAKKPARGKKSCGLQSADDDREAQRKRRAGTSSQQHNQSHSLHNILSESRKKDSTIKSVDSWKSGSRSSSTSSPSDETDANSAKAVRTPSGKYVAGETENKTTKAEERMAEIVHMLETGNKPPELRKIPTKRRPKTLVLDGDDARFHDVDEVRGVDSELNNVDLRSDDTRPPKQGEEELSSPRFQSVSEAREAPPPLPPTTTSSRRHGNGRGRTIVKVVVEDSEGPQLPTLQQDSSPVKKDWATINVQPRPANYSSEPPPPPPPPAINFYSSQPPPPPPPRHAPSFIVITKPECATEKAVAWEEPHHKHIETNYSTIKSVTKKRQDERRPISRASQFPLQPFPRRGGHMDVKTNNATRKTSGHEVKSVADHRLPDPPCDDRNDTIGGREELCPIARIRLEYSKRTQLV
jgi:hypothetical protein